ncbi:MAG: hypothetical protein ACXWU6_06565, partial [Allosphingosinicella sp.]
MSLGALRDAHGLALAEALERRIADGTVVEIDVDLLAQEVGAGVTSAQAAAFLHAAAEAGLVTERSVSLCPLAGCESGPLDADEMAQRRCSHCGVDYGAEGLEPASAFVYRVEGKVGRDIPWLIVIHGMNTAGEWQEDLSWRIATKFKFSAPVFIYKYGIFRFGVLVRWRHKMQAKRLGRRLSAAFEHAEAQGFRDPPDVVIHSFGSQLFVLLLGMRAFETLRFGRVIATGAIVDPNYDWGAQIGRGRIEAILNHRGGRDQPVRWAQFAIPGTGPGARKGFKDPRAINLLDSDFGHSGCFTPEALSDNLADRGAWDRFLRLPLET